jgi:hypothetical protein
MLQDARIIVLMMGAIRYPARGMYWVSLLGTKEVTINH